MLNRTVGFELEGYCDDGLGDIMYAEIDYDDSLSDYGREVRTDPLDNLDKLDIIFKVFDDFGWYSMDNAGTHIHVDISDYTLEDRVRLLRFGAGIELIMFLMCEPSRYPNSFCTKLNTCWRKIYRKSFINQPIDFSVFSTLDEFTNYLSHEKNQHYWNGRYQWLNANVGRYPTVEFRIFQSLEDVNLAKAYGLLAHNIVDTVKHTDIQQLQFIIRTIYNQSTVEDMIKKLLEAVGLEEYSNLLVVRNPSLAAYLDNKFCKVTREEQEADAV